MTWNNLAEIETEYVILMRVTSTKRLMVMVESFHYINVMCLCNAIHDEHGEVHFSIPFVNVKLWMVKPLLLQLSLSIHVKLCPLL